MFMGRSRKNSGGQGMYEMASYIVGIKVAQFT